MALRIAGLRKPAPPVDEPVDEPITEGMDQDVQAEAAPELEPAQQSSDEPDANDSDAHKVDQNTSGYMGPEFGPFMCHNCVHYGDGTCEIVAGPIDPAGCCNLFHSPEEDGGSQPTEQPEEQPMEEPAESEEEPQGY